MLEIWNREKGNSAGGERLLQGEEKVQPIQGWCTWRRLVAWIHEETPAAGTEKATGPTNG